ncbi:MAG TPA: ABC transporter permease [Polyangium sp.]|nr:ABC transporter permease [Polyangium sp.]
MRFFDLLRSVRFVVRGRLRALLTLLGVMIGSGSIVVLASLLRSGEAALLRASQEATESDLVQVRREEANARDRKRTRRELSRDDARALRASGGIRGFEAQSESTKRTEAHAGDKKTSITLVSATPAARSLYRLELARGRFFVDADLERRARVCILGHEVWQKLFGDRGFAAFDADDLPRVVVEGHAWTVIGVLVHRPIFGSTDSTDIWNRKVLVPETTYDAILSPNHAVNRIYVRRTDTAEVTTPLSTLRRIVSSTLLRRHLGVKNFKVEDDESSSQDRLILSVVELLLLSTSLMALLVGGINIMNIMLVTVTERTREIGIRRAVGASRRAILAQFLLEAAAVSSVGGAFGVLGGVGFSWLLAQVMTQVVGPWDHHVEPWSVGLGLGLALVTGVVFGFYPAWRAARLDPIEALRTE